MAEQMKSITDARQNLTGLSQSAQEHMERYVITNQGQPQSVLVGYLDYQQMKAATELARRPQAVADIRTGLAQLGDGERLTPAQLMEKLGFASPEIDAIKAQFLEQLDIKSHRAGRVSNEHGRGPSKAVRSTDRGAHAKGKKAPAPKTQAV